MKTLAVIAMIVLFGTLSAPSPKASAKVQNTQAISEKPSVPPCCGDPIPCPPLCP